MASNLIRTNQLCCEVGWFDDLCGGDTSFLGVPDPERKSTFQHCSAVIQLADELGYDNILLPTSYMLGQETIPFAAAAALQTKQINLLTAVRTGEIHPPMLARHLATLDHMLKGRLTVNIINSDLPGMKEDHELRYKRCEEVIEILRMAWTNDRIEHKGEIYPSLSMDTISQMGVHYFIMEASPQDQKMWQQNKRMFFSCGLNQCHQFNPLLMNCHFVLRIIIEQLISDCVSM